MYVYVFVLVFFSMNHIVASSLVSEFELAAAGCNVVSGTGCTQRWLANLITEWQSYHSPELFFILSTRQLVSMTRRAGRADNTQTLWTLHNYHYYYYHHHHYYCAKSLFIQQSIDMIEIFRLKCYLRAKLNSNLLFCTKSINVCSSMLCVHFDEIIITTRNDK